MRERLKTELVKDPRYVARLEAAKQRPAVLVALTNYCNFSCKYCSTSLEVKKNRLNMDMDLFVSIVDQCAQAGIVPFFGQTYEPFAHPKIVEMIHYATSVGLHFNAATNGSLLRPKLNDIPMSLVISLSENSVDYAYRGSALPFDAYIAKIIQFTKHRIAADVPGALRFQFADYHILEQPSAGYDKKIMSGALIAKKMRQFATALGQELPLTEEQLLDAVMLRQDIPLFRGLTCSVSLLSTKIAPNTYEAFAAAPAHIPLSPQGYCDSCYLMASLQADGGLAYCCCDPTAKTVVHHLKADEKLLDIWLGEKMEAVRRGFQQFAPTAPFCRKCLYHVTEHVKPNLTVSDQVLVATILREKGIHASLPWFEFPAQ